MPKRFVIPTPPARPLSTSDDAEAAKTDAAKTDAAKTDAAAPDKGAADGDALSFVLEALENEKAEDVVSIDLRGKSSVADHMVIASGRSSRHVAAICEKLMDRMKAMTGVRPRAEGVEHGDWALIDASDVIVHVFRPEVREFYALEKMWAPGAPPPAADPKKKID